MTSEISEMTDMQIPFNIELAYDCIVLISNSKPFHESNEGDWFALQRRLLDDLSKIIHDDHSHDEEPLD